MYNIKSSLESNTSINDDYYGLNELKRSIIKKKEPYVFTITATNSSGNSSVSDSTTDVLPLVVPILSNFNATPNVQGSSPIANCSINVDNGGTSITQITITSGTNTIVITPTLTSSSTQTGIYYTNLQVPSTGVGTSGIYTFTLNGLTQNTSYTFSATATNIVGISTSVSASSITSLSVPSAPTNVVATAGDSSCTLSFTAPSSNGGTPITEYTAISSPGGIVTNFTTAITSTGIGRAYIRGLTNGTSYTFTITAKNAIGTGPSSSPSNPVTPAGKPVAPTTITATSNENGQSTVTFSGQNLNGSTLTNYTVTATPSSGTAITATGNATPIIVTGLTNGTQYTFNVTITTANGSATSTATTTATPGGKPDKITSVTASPGSKLVTLTFPQPNTNGTPITSYTINAYYTDSTNAVKMETLTIPVTSSNYSISGNNVTITLYTKSNDAKFATGSVITNATPATTKTIFTSVQPYAHVPLVTYPVGYERMNKNKKDKSKYCLILCIILISIFILYLLNSKRR